MDSQERIVVVRLATDATSDQEAIATIYHLLKHPAANHENATVESIRVAPDDLDAAYAVYDSDPRTNGPEDREAFADAVAAYCG